MDEAKELARILSDLRGHVSPSIHRILMELTRAALALADTVDTLRAENSQLKEQLKHCGGENCMGWKDDDVTSWVRQELYLETLEKLNRLEKEIVSRAAN